MATASGWTRIGIALRTNVSPSLVKIIVAAITSPIASAASGGIALPI
jgi:hypothetical protein